jgi:hypothetical protein
MVGMEPDVEKNIIAQSMRSGLPLPERIKNAPTLDLGLDFFFRAWIELGSERPIGFDEGPIPWDSIRKYCNEYDIVGELREDTFYLVRSMDNAYLKYRRDKAKKQQLSQQKGKNKPRGNK